MSKSKTSQKSRLTSSSPSRPGRLPSPVQSAPPIISGRWLLGGLAIALLAAILCAWGTLCILFWQGSWQLLYHPTSAVTRTPANVNLPFESIGFATNASGQPQLRGWWISSASQPRFTALYLHGQSGNLTDALDVLTRYHQADLNVFAFDYRGYGQSHFEHPSEKRWRDDTESALQYLTGTRHIPLSSIILIGRDLGADLAIEIAAVHPDLAGVILDEPLASPTNVIFNDARSRLVPARLLVSDRWNTAAAASNLLIPSLWLYSNLASPAETQSKTPAAYEAVPARKAIVWLSSPPDESRQLSSAISAFLDQLQKSAK